MSTGPRIGRGQPINQIRGVLAERVDVSIDLDPFLDMKALEGYSSLSRRTLERLMHDLPPDQALPYYRVTGKKLVRRSHFDTWIEQYYVRGRPSLVKALRELGLPTNLDASPDGAIESA